MKRIISLGVVTASLATIAGPVTAQEYRGVSFATPDGWVSGMQDGRFVLAPRGMKADDAIIVVLTGSERLANRPLGEWLRTTLAAHLPARATVLQATDPQFGRSAAGFEMLSGGRTVQDAGGGVRLQVYQAISDGTQASMAIVVTASEQAFRRYTPPVKAVFESLRFTEGPTVAGGSPSAPGKGPASPPPPASGGRKETLSIADLQGSWAYSTASHTDYVSPSGGHAGSSTIAYGEYYTFAPNGTYEYSFSGMVDSRMVREKDSGTWGFENGLLAIRGRRKEAKRYRIVDYRTAADGSSLMTLLDEYYPLTEGNLGLYGQKWAREAVKPRGR